MTVCWVSKTSLRTGNQNLAGETACHRYRWVRLASTVCHSSRSSSSSLRDRGPQRRRSLQSQERQRKRAFETLYGGVRKVDLYNKEMGSISDLLGGMATHAAKRAKPTIGEKVRGWAVRFRWPAHSWAQTPRLGSKSGGGKGGYAASKQASKPWMTSTFT